MSATPNTPGTLTRTSHPVRRRPLDLVLAPFKSVWFGIVLLTVLLIYMSVGSALPLVRESRPFEMTEFEWFNWWPFAVLVVLMCLNITVVTITRIPLTWIKLGVWMIHTGIVLMCLSSWWYFAHKVEGDTPVIRRSVLASLAGAGDARFPALPGAAAQVGGYTLRVATIDPAWPILSGEHEGESAFSVSVMVTPPEGEPFIRQMLAGYPQYTEDILPGRGRAIKNIGTKLVDPGLELSLAPEPQRWFYLAQTRALYVRDAGTDEWSAYPMPGLPRYNDTLVDPATGLWPAPGDPLTPSVPLARPVAGTAAALGTEAEVTGFVRYATVQRRLGPAADPAEGQGPAVTLLVSAPDGRSRRVQLAPEIDGLERTADGAFAAVVLHSAGELDDFLAGARPVVTASADGQTRQDRVDETLSGNPALGWTEIGGFGYRVRLIADGLVMPDGSQVSAAILDVRTPEGERFRRLVSDRGDGGAVQDIETEEAGGAAREHVDDRLTINYTPGASPASMTVILGPDDTVSLLTAPTGSAPAIVPAQTGEPVALPGGGSVLIQSVIPSARIDERPAVTPRRQRDRAAGEFYSLIRVRLGDEEHWVPFCEYVFDSPAYRYAGRFRFEPVTFTLPGGRRVEVLYSRERRPLPAPVVLDDFHLKANTGGFNGTTPSIRDWISEVRYATDDGWSEPVEIRTNHPASFEGLSFFQARWDPPQQGAGGLAYTGLGVGSRSGVTVMLASSCLSVAGMLYVFYVKPSIQRRRVKRAMAAKHANTPAPEPSNAESSTPVEVGV